MHVATPAGSCLNSHRTWRRSSLTNAWRTASDSSSSSSSSSSRARRSRGSSRSGSSGERARGGGGSSSDPTESNHPQRAPFPPHLSVFLLCWPGQQPHPASIPPGTIPRRGRARPGAARPCCKRRRRLPLSRAAATVHAPASSIAPPRTQLPPRLWPLCLPLPPPIRRPAAQRRSAVARLCQHVLGLGCQRSQVKSR